MPWLKLLGEEDAEKTESTSWNAYIVPILAFKMLTVLSGSASRQGKIPRSIMSPKLTTAIIRVVRIPDSLLSITLSLFFKGKMLLDSDGWPKVFEEAIFARWNSPPPSHSSPMIIDQSSTQKLSQQIAASVVQNLTHLTSSFKSKFVGNIIQNIELAVAYLSVMLVVRPFYSALLPFLTVYLCRA